MPDSMADFDFSTYQNIFCDSKQALQWAHEQSLSKDALIRTSSPAMLFDSRFNIEHVESSWEGERTREFQRTIQKFSEDLYDALLEVPKMEREYALCMVQTAVMFHRIIYKAGCLVESDFHERRLFIQLEGYGGPKTNMLNSPWSQLLDNNPLFNCVAYKFKDDGWQILTAKGVDLWDRIKLGGLETVVYRLANKLAGILPNTFFKKEAIIASENELLIETAASLVLRGVKLEQLKSNVSLSSDEIVEAPFNKEEALQATLPIVESRIKQWVDPVFVPIVYGLFEKQIEQQLQLFNKLASKWEHSLDKVRHKKRVMLANSPGNVKGQSLSLVCRKKNIPLLAFEHGVTVEFSAFHGQISSGFDNTVSDGVFNFNKKVSEVENRSHFSKARQFVVGMSARHMRMKNLPQVNGKPPIVFVSLNSYRGNHGLFGARKSDYRRALDEQKIICDVLDRLPYRVLYKTYPEDTRRYADQDPVIQDVIKADNIELYSKKIDLRYLLAGHKLIVSSVATSTVGWLVMSDIPLVFINTNDNQRLTSEAHESFSKGLFVFDDKDDDFHKKLREFLSLPFDEIERLWKLKHEDREILKKQFFSEFSGGAGVRAAKIILRDYL